MVPYPILFIFSCLSSEAKNDSVSQYSVPWLKRSVDSLNGELFFTQVTDESIVITIILITKAFSIKKKNEKLIPPV